jgi:uncharacterized membrane protein HdeD (DUF308 family)
MITFGYKNTSSSLIRAVVAIVIGLVMVVSRTNAIELAIRIIAAFLVATGVVSFVVGRRRHNEGDASLMSVNAGVDILLGVLLFLFPGFVARLMVYIVGFALLGFGIFQIVTLVSALKVMKLGFGSFIMPVAVVIAGGFLVANPSFLGDAIGVVAGAALILYGVSELFAIWKMKKAIKEYEIHSAPQKKEADETPSEIKDVEYEKVEE